jgi:hypothetical protein
MRLCSSRPPSALNRSPKRYGRPDLVAPPVESHALCADNISHVSASINNGFSLSPHLVLVCVLFTNNVDFKKIELLPIP